MTGERGEWAGSVSGAGRLGGLDSAHLGWFPLFFLFFFFPFLFCVLYFVFDGF